MAVDFKVLNEEINSLAERMDDCCQERIAVLLYEFYLSTRKFPNPFGGESFHYPLVRRDIAEEVYTMTVSRCLSRKENSWQFRPEKGASFITFFKERLKNAHSDYLTKKHREVPTIPLVWDEDGRPVDFDVPYEETGFIAVEEGERSEIDVLRDVAEVVAYQKWLQRGCEKNDKTYIEAFFTVDVSRLTRIGGAMVDGGRAVNAKAFSAAVCKDEEDDGKAFFQAMDGIMLIHMIVSPCESMKQVVYTALRPLIEENLRERDSRKLVHDAYEGYPKYSISLPTTGKRRIRYDIWLQSITAEEQFWKEGYSL